MHSVAVAASQISFYSYVWDICGQKLWPEQTEVICLGIWRSLNFILFLSRVGEWWRSSSQLDDNRKKTSELTQILDWLHANRLSLNINKTNFTIFGSQFSARDYSICTIHLKGQDIKHANECQFLGIYLDTHLTWKRHIERISSKMSSAIFAINRARDFLSKHALRCLYFALVHSHLTYGIHVWGNSMTIKKIIILQKRAIRWINKVWYRSHTEPLFKSNQILKFEDM